MSLTNDVGAFQWVVPGLLTSFSNRGQARSWQLAKMDAKSQIRWKLFSVCVRVCVRVFVRQAALFCCHLPGNWTKVSCIWLSAVNSFHQGSQRGIEKRIRHRRTRGGRPKLCVCVCVCVKEREWSVSVFSYACGLRKVISEGWQRRENENGVGIEGGGMRVRQRMQWEWGMKYYFFWVEECQR